MLAAEQAIGPAPPVSFSRRSGLFFSINTEPPSAQKHETRTALLQGMGYESDGIETVNTGDAMRRSIQLIADPIPSMTRGLQMSLRFSIHFETKVPSKLFTRENIRIIYIRGCRFSANTRFRPIASLVYRLQTESIGCGLGAVKRARAIGVARLSLEFCPLRQGGRGVHREKCK